MFYRARYYNPAWGRFVSEDPIGVAGGVNLYAYVGGQPTGYGDPSGLTAAGALTGARWGGTLSGLAGVETGPGDIPIGLLGAAAGAAIGDWLTGPDQWLSEPADADKEAIASGSETIAQGDGIRKLDELCEKFPGGK